MVGEKMEENDTGFTRSFGQWGLHSLSFSYSFFVLLTIEWGDLYIGYMGNREKGKQVTGPNLNGLSPNIQ
jgi:hypothetical protein